MKNLIFLGFVLIALNAYPQNNTDISLFMKENPEKQLAEVFSESGDMYKTLGHHGPAIENEYMALRLYFNFKAAIDVYSKTKPGLELAKAKWYPTPEQQKQGWGADYYKVGKTIGLGGVRLWDGEKVVYLDPVSERSATVVKEENSSYIEMLSKGVPYKERKVDIMVRVTVYSGMRKAKVEAYALSDEDVQFVTGINYHEGMKAHWADNYFLTWGEHPEDVAAETVDIGAAITFNPEDFSETKDDGKQKLLISKPTKKIECWITSANSREAVVNSFKLFKLHVEQSLPKMYNIENCVNQYSIDKSEQTEFGHRFWFSDKTFAKGKGIKLNVVKPNSDTHPPHLHEEDEFFYVLEGKAKFHLNGEEVVVGANTSLYCPANMAHGISNAGDTELKYLVIKQYTTYK